MTEEGTTVFIIDDDPSARRGLSRLVRAAGMNVEAYGSALEFLERKHYAGYGCILLDVKMPKMNGVEVCRKIRADSKTSYIPVVMLSAKAQAEEVKEGLSAGANKYLCKPISFPDLLREIKEILAK